MHMQHDAQISNRTARTKKVRLEAAEAINECLRPQKQGDLTAGQALMSWGSLRGLEEASLAMMCTAALQHSPASMTVDNSN